jgi:hypothetical protein
MEDAGVPLARAAIEAAQIQAEMNDELAELVRAMTMLLSGAEQRQLKLGADRRSGSGCSATRKRVTQVQHLSFPNWLLLTKRVGKMGKPCWKGRKEHIVVTISLSLSFFFGLETVRSTCHKLITLFYN